MKKFECFYKEDIRIGLCRLMQQYAIIIGCTLSKLLIENNIQTIVIMTKENCVKF